MPLYDAFTVSRYNGWSHATLQVAPCLAAGSRCGKRITTSDYHVWPVALQVRGSKLICQWTSARATPYPLGIGVRERQYRLTASRTKWEQLSTRRGCDRRVRSRPAVRSRSQGLCER